MTVYAPPWGLSTLVKEFTMAACIMQSTLKELSTLVSGGGIKRKQTNTAAADNVAN